MLFTLFFALVACNFDATAAAAAAAVFLFLPIFRCCSVYGLKKTIKKK